MPLLVFPSLEKKTKVRSACSATARPIRRLGPRTDDRMLICFAKLFAFEGALTRVGDQRRSRKPDAGAELGVGCLNEDHGLNLRVDVGGTRWRPAVQSNEMRNPLRSFVESISYTRSGRNRDGNGPEQRILWYGTATTTRKRLEW